MALSLAMATCPVGVAMAQSGGAATQEPAAAKMSAATNAGGEASNTAARGPDEAPALAPPHLVAGGGARYPEAALASRAQGRVRLQLEIDAAGRVARAAVVEAPAPELAQAALDATKGLVFAPATRAGAPIAARVLYDFNFVAPEPQWSLTGSVHLAGTHKPIRGAQVSLYAPEGSQQGTSTPCSSAETGVSDATGVFRLKVRGAGACDVEVSAPGHRSYRTRIYFEREPAARLQVLLTPEVPAPQAEPPELQVVVTGSRSEEDRRDAVVITDVVTRTRIEQSGARNAAEALQHEPALQLERNLGTGAWLRGLDPEYTLVLLDGDRMIGRLGGAIDLSRVGVERIERIEIVRGPASALYGSDALAGVINIIGRESQEPLDGEVMASGGGTPKHGALADGTLWVTGKPLDTLHVQAGGGVHHRAAIESDAPPVTSLSERLQWSAYGSATYTPSAPHRVRATLEYDQIETQGVDGGAGDALFDRTQLREQFLAGLAYRLRPSPRISWDTRYRTSLYREQYLSDQRDSTAMDRLEDNRERLHQVTTNVVLRPTDQHVTTVGVEQLVQHIDAARLSRPSDRFRTSVFAQHQWRPWQARHRDRRIECDQQLGVVPGIRLDADSQFGEQLSPKLALRFDPLPCLSLRAGYGRGFRAPTFQRLYLRFENPSAGYIVLGNPDLKAERSHGLDFSAAWSPSERIHALVAVFHNELSDMIAVVTEEDGTGGTQFSYANLHAARTTGFEARVRFSPSEWLTVDLSHTITDTWNGEEQRRLENVAAHRPTVALQFNYQPWQLAALLRASAQFGRVYFEDDDGDGSEERRAPGPLTTGNLRVNKGFGDHVEAFAGIDNLLQAEDDFSTLRPRTYYAGLRGRY